jgi:hypothetical protein
MPAVMIWHNLGHLRSIDSMYLGDWYRIYCYERCEGWGARVVMLRADRAEDLSPVFQDWTKIEIENLP